ncbi:MAG: DUF924 domain-containing protein [Hyphomicrobiales bacterium]|nr:MAG: DUF924 domain-containing protein [Hyphomicrobiales bacterium]
MTASNADPFAVLDFWWRAGPAKWFAKDEAFDAAIRDQFGDAVEAALVGELDHWAKRPHGSMALLILIDQFPRNLFRDSAKAFAGDEKARDVADQALAKGFDKVFPVNVRRFFFLPFEHSEDIADQERAVDLFMASGDDEGLFWAYKHLDAIRRFGRFPHRNAVLGRESSAAEQAFLDKGGFSG